MIKHRDDIADAPPGDLREVRSRSALLGLHPGQEVLEVHEPNAGLPSFFLEKTVEEKLDASAKPRVS